MGSRGGSNRVAGRTFLAGQKSLYFRLVAMAWAVADRVEGEIFDQIKTEYT